MPSSAAVTGIDTQGEAAWEPRIIALVCNWCSYVGADLAGTSRTVYPASVRIIRVPCSGRIDPVFVVRAFQRGADGVLVSGCHPGDCHYNKGNYYARRRMMMLTKLLEFSGLDPRRIQMSWVSASEGGKWAQIISDMTEQIRQLGPNRKGVAAPLAAGAGDGSAATGDNGNGRALDGSNVPRMRFDTTCTHAPGDGQHQAAEPVASHGT